MAVKISIPVVVGEVFSILIIITAGLPYIQNDHMHYEYVCHCGAIIMLVHL